MRCCSALARRQPASGGKGLTERGRASLSAEEELLERAPWQKMSFVLPLGEAHGSQQQATQRASLAWMRGSPPLLEVTRLVARDD